MGERGNDFNLSTRMLINLESTHKDGDLLIPIAEAHLQSTVYLLFVD